MSEKVQIPEPHIIEELERQRIQQEEERRLPLHAPFPIYTDPPRKEEKKEERVVIIQL